MPQLRLIAPVLIGIVLAAAFGLGRPGVAAAMQDTPDRRAAAGTLSVRFEGGTVATYIDAVREAASNINIAVLDDVSGIPMPRVEITRVAPWQALALLDSIQHKTPDGTIRVSVREISHAKAVDQDSAAAQHTLFVVRTHIEPRSRRADRGDQTLVLDLGDLINEKLTDADILTAIEAMLQLAAADAEPATVRFHEATGLLIARGDLAQIGAIEQIVQRLREARERELAQSDAPRRIAELEHRVQQLSAMLGEAEAKLAAEQEHVTEARVRSNILERELDRLRRTLDRRENEVLELQRQLELLQRRQSQ